MKLSLLSSVLVLGTASAEVPRVFARSTRKRSSPPTRIRQDAAKSAKKVTQPSHWPKKSETMKATKTFKMAKTLKASRSSEIFKMSVSSTTKHSSKQEETHHYLSKASKESMSYAFDQIGSLPFFDPSDDPPFSFDFISMPDFESDIEYPSGDLPFSFDFSMPAIEYPTTDAPPITVATFTDLVDSTSEDVSSPSSFYGPAIFEYLSQCAQLELAVDTCLVSNTIDEFMVMDEPDDCGPPVVTMQGVSAIMDATKEQCEAMGTDISDGEFNTTLNTFMELFANRKCFESFCDKDSDSSELVFKIHFDRAAECAGVEMDVHECVLDHVFELALLVADPTAGRIRRVLQESESECRPTQRDLGFMVNLLLEGTEAMCYDMGITVASTNWDKAFADLMTIFSSDCWSWGDCTEEIVSVDYNDWPTESPIYDDEKESRFVVTEDGHQCIFEIDTDPELERSLELSFFYQVETTSTGEPSLEGIERALMELACSDGRRTRVLNEDPLEIDVVAVDSYPDDVVSTNYTCVATKSNANSCFVIEGKATIILEGKSTDYDDEIKLDSYSKLEELFAFLPNVLDDSNVVDVNYIGKYPPSATTIISDAPVNEPTEDQPVEDEPTIGKLSNDDAETDSESFTALLIATSGGLVAMALLITGFHRMNEQTKETIQPDEKSNDGSKDGQSTANDTAAMTYDGSCDRSDVSSLSSPTSSAGDALSPASYRGQATKFFVLAEEEEENWRELSILPALAQDDGTLENVSEEGSFITSTSSEDSQMSV